ncbi:MAG TPA: alanine racemase [Trueperaceae bacterium]
MATATISLAALQHNLHLVRGHLQAPTRVLAAVKSDAYGHGAPAVARQLVACGVDWLGVATRAEALELRASGIGANILIFSPLYDGLQELLDADVALPVVDAASLEAVERAARQAGITARVHLKVDTGMGRLGELPKDAARLAETAHKSTHVELEGLWTHFSCADESPRDFTLQQIERFCETITLLERHGIQVPLKHAANSPGLLAYPEAHFDMVRPGIALYGYHSTDLTLELEPGFRPILTLSAPITFVKRVAPGRPVSYGATWRAQQETTLATVRIGYADGYPRNLANRGKVRLHGELRPIAGKVCMDQLMVDAGDLDVRVGDRAVLFGPEGPTAEEVGRLAGTISYEMLTSLGKRVEREYLA